MSNSRFRLSELAALGSDRMYDVLIETSDSESLEVLPKTFLATLKVIEQHEEKKDIIEVFFDRLDIESFRLKSGRLNVRGIARALSSALEERNLARAEQGYEVVTKIGLRTLETYVREFLSSPEQD